MRAEIVNLNGKWYVKATDIITHEVFIMREFGEGYDAMEAAEAWMRPLSCSEARAYARANPL